VEMSDDRLEISPLTFDPRFCAPKSSFIYVYLFSLILFISFPFVPLRDDESDVGASLVEIKHRRDNISSRFVRV